MRKGQKHKETSKKLLSKAIKKAHKLGKFKTSFNFKTGHEPWNKGKKTGIKSPSTFKKGQYVGENHPSWKGGVQEFKKDCVYLYDSVNKAKRRPRVIYEQFHGPIPKGYVIYHIDGNNKNDHPTNLEAISRKELRRRNLIKGRWRK
jgi:hypothetical protein